MANEIRLIDANALKRAIRAESWVKNLMVQLTLDYIDIIIDEAPTVDAVEANPVVHAHWVIERWSSGYVKRCNCSNCGNYPKDAYNPPKYCDNCGAHMDEEVADGN